MVHTPYAPMAAMGSRPLEEGQDRAGCPDRVPEVQMVGTWVIEVHRALREVQPEQFAIKHERSSRLGGHHRDMMKSSCDLGRQSTSLVSLPGRERRPRRLPTSATYESAFGRRYFNLEGLSISGPASLAPGSWQGAEIPCRPPCNSLGDNDGPNAVHHGADRHASARFQAS